MANKDGNKAVNEMNIKEFMEYIDDQYNISLSSKQLEGFINFLDGFMVTFPAPERFSQIRDTLMSTKNLLEIISRFSK